MAWNLFVAYDLMQPGQNYEAVRQRIRSLGLWHQVQLSLFYVHSVRSPQDAYAHVAQAMDANDRLIVIDANGAVVGRGENATVGAINAIWSLP